MIFGMFYSTIRYSWNTSVVSKYEQNDPIQATIRGFGSLSGALVATILSSPFNYVRNMQYATIMGEKQRGTWFHLNLLVKEAIEEEKPFSFLQRRLRIGWGSLRVAFGMGVGNELYDLAKLYIDVDKM